MFKSKSAFFTVIYTLKVAGQKQIDIQNREKWHEQKFGLKFAIYTL